MAWENNQFSINKVMFWEEKIVHPSFMQWKNSSEKSLSQSIINLYYYTADR